MLAHPGPAMRQHSGYRLADNIHKHSIEHSDPHPSFFLDRETPWVTPLALVNW